MKSVTANGIIIRRFNLGEADRLLTIFTKEQGKITVKAKGVRKITSKRASHIELLNHVQFSMYKAGGMPVLTEAISIETFPLVKTNLKKIGLAYHICELIDGLCPEGQEHTAVFDLFYILLSKLEVTEHQLGSIIHTFELELLQSLGYWSQQEKLEGAKASFFIEDILERKLKSREILKQLL